MDASRAGAQGSGEGASGAGRAGEAGGAGGASGASDALLERAEGGARAVIRARWAARLPGGRVPSLEELLALPHTALHSEPTRLLRLVPLEAGLTLFVKVYLFSAVTGAGSLLGRTVAEREFEGLRLFEEAGLPAAAPVGWAVERRAGIVRRAAVIEEALPGSIDLQAWAASLGARAADPADAERGAVLDALGALFRRAHAAGLACGPKGAHIRNVLLLPLAPGAAPRLFFVDLPNALRASGAALERERARDLGRLVIRLAGLCGDEGRARFLDAYHARDSPEARALLGRAIEAERRVAADETHGAALRKKVRRMFRKLMGLRGKRRPAPGSPGGPPGPPAAGSSGTLPGGSGA